jgi:D-aminopeptidase
LAREKTEEAALIGAQHDTPPGTVPGVAERRVRLRQSGITIGTLDTGPENAITDVPGVLVGHATVVADEPHAVRSGVTFVVPRDGGVWTDYAYAGSHVLNGNGEMTGLIWVEESGMLGSPIGITNTAQVGLVRDRLVHEAFRLGIEDGFHLPVVGETWDGWLSTIESFPVGEADVDAALASASSGPVAEGCVGGGTGMICHEFKGGIGTASRVVEVGGSDQVVGVLVQANYGARADLRVDGVPVGRVIGVDQVPSPWEEAPNGGSIIVVIATDAPLLPGQCRRLARRATVGLGRVGGYGHDSSGDIFFAFATGNHLEAGRVTSRPVTTLPNEAMDPLFHAVADATEESILNALCAAVTTTGREGRVAHALPIDLMTSIVRSHQSD